MLTLKILKEYAHFDGNFDSWFRCHNNYDQIPEEEWELIEKLRLAIFTIEYGKAADSFIKNTKQLINENTDSEQARELLWKIGKKK